MKLAVFAAVLLFACASTRQEQPCEAEHEAVDAANAAFRRATVTYTNAVEKDALSRESGAAWEAVNKAATQQTTARTALSRCLGTEAP